MRRFIGKTLKRGGAVLAIVALSLLGLRIYDTQRGAPLEPWHTFVPEELSIKQLDRAGWADYLKAEDRAFASVRAEVSRA